jgi:hypothetical protein
LRALEVAIPPPPAPTTLAEARTEAEALAAVSRRARQAGPEAALRALAALPPPLRTRAGAALARGTVEAERRDAVLARIATPHAGAITGPALEAWRARLPAEWTATLLEEHARCPFRLLLTRGARLRDDEAAGLDIDGRDEGSLLHAILERWVRGRLERRAWPPIDSPEDREEARAVAEGVLHRFEREGRTGDPAVWAARRQAVLARLARLVAAEAAQPGPLEPRLLEFRFGGGSDRPPLRLEAGGEAVLVQGRLDRVDAAPDRLLLIDYKNGADPRRSARLLEPKAFGVESFQVPLYLLAAARELPGRAPAATFQLLKGARRLTPVEGAPDEPALAGAVVGAVQRIRQGQLPIVSRDCGHCPFGAVCRFQGVATLDEGGTADA